MSLDHRHAIFNFLPVLLLQDGNRGQDAFRKVGGVMALIAEASLYRAGELSPNCLEKPGF
jgi:hypothetical protein